MEQLLQGLGYGEEDIAKITNAMSKEKIYLTKEENIEERYNKLKEQKADIEGQLAEANKTIKGLKSSNADNEALQSAIKQHEETIMKLKADSEAKIRDLTLEHAVSLALSNSKAKHPDLLSSKVDKSKLVIGEDGKVSGIDEQIKDMQKTYKDLFVPSVSGTAPKIPDSQINTVTREQFDSMGYKDRIELFNTNKELYDTLTRGD